VWNKSRYNKHNTLKKKERNKEYRIPNILKWPKTELIANGITE
jgi:hypothetical protein